MHQIKIRMIAATLGLALSVAGAPSSSAADRVVAPVQPIRFEPDLAPHDYTPLPHAYRQVAQVCMARLRTCFVATGYLNGGCTCCFKDVGCVRGVITVGPRF